MDLFFIVSCLKQFTYKGTCLLGKIGDGKVFSAGIPQVPPYTDILWKDYDRFSFLVFY
jgi:hypothetical protein